MKSVIALFIFAVMIGSLVSVSAQFAQNTVATTTQKGYTADDCKKLGSDYSQKLSYLNRGLDTGIDNW